MVTHDAPVERFTQVLEALAAQDHPNLDVLVVDTGTIDPTERVRAVLPAARVHRVEGNPGFGAAANVVLDTVSGAEFYVFCHDDAAPDPGAVRALVDAAQRWDADIVGPKLVAWDDRHRFAQFGVTIDRLGTALPMVQRGELDQGQHDGARDVFAVPGAFTLVRAARFAEIGGFDEAITYLGDDISLSWRARLTGARVLVTSAARVRHAEAFGERPLGREAAALQARHRLRLVLTSYRPGSLVRAVPEALVLSLAEVLAALVSGRPRRARAALGAWVWNLRRLSSLAAARRAVARFRRVSDRRQRRYQVRGLVGPRLTVLRVGSDGQDQSRHGAGSRRIAAVPVRGHMEVDPSLWTPATALMASGVAAIVLFGCRHLLTRFVPAVGEMVPAGGSAGDLLAAWAGGWRPVGLGAGGATPALAGALGLLGAVLAGHMGLARTLLIVGLLPAGIVGAHRLPAPAGSKRAQVAAAVAYAAVPLPYDALSAGRWSAVAAYGAAPWMLGRLARASRVAPFGPLAGTREDPLVTGEAPTMPIAGHRLWQHVVATGAVTALLGLLVPAAPLVLVLMGAGVVVGGLLAGQRVGLGRVAATTAGGAVVAALLLLPTTVEALTSSGGPAAGLGTERQLRGLTAVDLLALRTGPMALVWVPFALLGAAAVPLLVGRRWRLAWATQAWTVAVAAWGLVWAREQGWVTARLPDAGVLLAPAAAGLALAAGLAVSAIEHDLHGWSWRPDLRRLVAGAGVLALAVSTVSVVVAAMDGRWDMPRDDFAGLMGFVEDDVRDAPSRVLWVAEDDLLPGGDGWPLGDRLSYTASTTAVVPGVADRWPTMAGGASSRLGEALDLALSHRTSRLGRVLAPLGVQYVAVPQRLAPSDHGGAATTGAAADELVGALAEQLDLQRVRVDRQLVLYRNTAFAPLRWVAPEGADLDATAVAAMAAVDLTAAGAVLDGGDGRTGASGTVPDDTTVVQSATSSANWRLTVDGRAAERARAFGWADAFEVVEGGEAELRYRTPVGVRMLAAAQATLWLIALGIALRMRFGRGELQIADWPTRRDGDPPADERGPAAVEAGAHGARRSPDLPGATPTGPAKDPDRVSPRLPVGQGGRR